jgi:hypothetical protein
MIDIKNGLTRWLALIFACSPAAMPFGGLFETVVRSSSFLRPPQHDLQEYWAVPRRQSAARGAARIKDEETQQLPGRAPFSVRTIFLGVLAC